MARPDSAGTFEVSFDVLDRETGEPTDEEHRLPIGMGGPVFEERDGGRVIVDEPPVLSNKRAWTGELTQHELDWLRGLPGVNYNLRYRFTVKKAGGRSRDRGED